MKRVRTLLLILAAIVPAAALAQPYKCVGPGGKVSFGDQPCEKDRPLVKDDFDAEKDPKGLTAADRARIKAFEAIIMDKTTNAEQKTAALLEASNLRRGLEAALSPEDEAKRVELTKLLTDKDPAKRAELLRLLRALYKD